ncbi:hypothetical protein FSP39_013359 [Pinctada imbricata]|uniref:Fibrinogen C-terminal domain-containing protein n=1 Tax=Pinctada imbricata TaxID=66713 RepID=A0AA88YCF4_PINIB|nr:hypothetical protein FSP39_013359 [Pinctada imbricata]
MRGDSECHQYPLQIADCFKPKDCLEIKQKYPDSKSGVYQIYPGNTWIGVQVSCDMDRSCGGWTVIQRREDGSIDFQRNWKDYKYGFGKPDKEHWLGNDIINQLTGNGNHELLIVMEDFDDTVRYAHYGTFFIGNESVKYKLTVKKYSGNAGDSLSYHNGFPFSTKDKDNDGKSSENCSTRYKGAWWYKSCHRSNLNGAYLKGTTKTFADGVAWYDWRGYYYSLKSTVMMVR